MPESIKGKCLVRRSMLPSGEPILIVCGIFFPSESIECYAEADEMWVGEFVVADVNKYTGQTPSSTPTMNSSPEDFLEGKGMAVSEWKLKNAD